MSVPRHSDPVPSSSAAASSTLAMCLAPPPASATAASTTLSPAAGAVPTLSNAPTGGQRRRSSRLSEEEQNVLERRIEQRPDVDKLVASNIMKEGGRLAESKERLARELRKDALGAAVAGRSSLDELRKDGILDDADLSVAPCLSAAAKKLERGLLCRSINEQLAERDEVNDLERARVLRSTDVAPALRGPKIALEHALTRDRVGHLLEGRSSPEDLADSGILRQGGVGSNVAARLAGAARELEHHMTTDRVQHLLERRSDSEHLEAKGLLDSSVAPAIQGAQRKLQHNLNRSNLYHALRGRPSLSELEARGVYVPAYDVGEEDDEEPAPHVPRRAAVRGRSAAVPPPRSRQAPPPPRRAPRNYAPLAAEGPAPGYGYEPVAYMRRSKAFHLNRILLKYVALMGEADEISPQQKGLLKDLIVDQDPTIMSVAETFDADQDINEFKDSLIRLADRRA